MDINNKNIVITGAASGIGLSLLTAISQKYNANIVATDLNAFDHSIPPNVHIHQGDISTQEGVDALFDFALEKMGSIDLFVANAGFAYYEQTEQEDWQHIDRIYRCNTFSPIYSSHKMARLNQDREYGMLITASFMGIFSLPGYSLYSSTKAALLSWADAYRREKDDKGQIMMLCPVATKTHFFDTTAPVPWPSQTADQVTQAAIKGVLANKHRIYPSKLSVLTLFLNWVFPLVMPIYKGMEQFKFKGWLKSRQSVEAKS
jgi:short-subunit dehydrogenase